MNYKRKYLADLILEKLIVQKQCLKNEFNVQGRINSCVIDDLLPDEIAKNINMTFTSPE